MSRLVKIINNKYVQIEEYRNPNVCFSTSEYNDFEDYCTLRETFDPFEIFYENQELTDKCNKLEQQCKKQKEVIDKLNFIKSRKNQGASQENINKMAIEFVNSYLKEVSE